MIALRLRGGHLEIVKMIAEGRDAEIFALDDGRVLRLLRAPATDEMAEREAAALTAVRSVIPNVPAVARTVQVAGRPGIVMDFIEGVDLMKRLGMHPWSLFTVARITGEIHARINSIAAPASLPRLRDSLRRRIESIDQVPEKLSRRADRAREPSRWRRVMPRRFSSRQHHRARGQRTGDN